MKCLLGKHSKRIKLFEYSNLYLCLFFHYIIQGSLCSQRDHEKVMLKDSGVQNYTFGLGPVGLRTRLMASKYAFACYHVTQRNTPISVINVFWTLFLQKEQPSERLFSLGRAEGK